MLMTQQYDSERVMNASPMELILMLYDGGIRSLNHALEAFDLVDDLDHRNQLNKYLLEAQSYITELACSLDVEQGGEMAQTIEQIYEFMLNHLVNANTSGRREPIGEVLTMLSELRDGWKQAMDSMPKDQVQETIPVERKSSFNFAG